MSRNSYLEFSINHTKVTNGIKEILGQLKTLNQEYEKVKMIKFGVDTSGLKNVKQEVKEVSNAYKELYGIQKQIVKETSKGNKPKVDTSGVIPNGTEVGKAKDFIQSIRNIGFAIAGLKVVSDKFKSFNEFESSIFNLSIASKKSLSDITAMKQEFLLLSRELPVSANSLIQTTDMLVRTGKTYADSLKITKETAKLSVATGDDLEYTASTVSKLMTALNINADDTSKVLNTLHSTAIQTASSMESISGGFKQVAGVLGAMAFSSGRAGKDLDSYKQSLLALGSAGIGVMNNLGKSASELI